MEEYKNRLIREFTSRIGVQFIGERLGDFGYDSTNQENLKSFDIRLPIKPDYTCTTIVSLMINDVSRLCKEKAVKRSGHVKWCIDCDIGTEKVCTCNQTGGGFDQRCQHQSVLTTKYFVCISVIP
jgi:hypothetical protein